MAEQKAEAKKKKREKKKLGGSSGDQEESAGDNDLTDEKESDDDSHIGVKTPRKSMLKTHGPAIQDKREEDEEDDPVPMVVIAEETRDPYAYGEMDCGPARMSAESVR